MRPFSGRRRPNREHFSVAKARKRCRAQQYRLAHALRTRRRMTDSSLVLTALTKKYGDTVAVDAIDLTIASGSYCCLLGPSGCGKTSTLRMIAGHESASSGEILLGGKYVTNASPADRGTAMMFQSYALFP